MIESLNIHNILKISGDNYHPKGVGENDILIIATAQNQGVQLITNENIQLTLPLEPRKYKIPAVCKLPNINVVAIDFVDYFKQSKQSF